MKTINALLIAGLALVGSAASAQNLTIGMPSSGGSGCSGGAAPRIYNRSGQLMIKLGFKVSDRDLRKNCALAFPVSVGAGYKLVVATTNLQTATGGRVAGIVGTEIFFADQLVGSHRVVAPLQIGSKWTGDMAIGAESQCGASTLLRINTDLQVKSRGTARLDTQAIKLVAVKCP